MIMNLREFLNMKECKKANMCVQIETNTISIKEASELLKISYRQMKRIWKKYNENGIESLAHGLRGKASNHCFDPQTKKKMLQRYEEKYRDSGPTLAIEFLFKEGFPTVSPETFRKWLIKENLHTKKRKRRQHRKRRARKSNFGDMVQFDGSIHDWFEGRYKKCWLMVLVDDATGIVHAQFTPPEGTEAAMRAIWSWVKQYGCPSFLYCDRKNCYVTKASQTIEEELEAKPHFTDFTRACNELGIGVINANSPQAKGRVERVNGVLQDRLVKEMRYANINTPDEANKFLQEKFLPEYNRKFKKEPAHKADHHKAVSKKIKLAEVFSYHSIRVVQKDWVIQYKKIEFQLSSKQPCTINPRNKVTILEQLDGVIHILYNDQKLNFKIRRVSKEGGHFYIGEKGDISIVA